MANKASWRALKPREGTPQLLVKTQFDKKGYEVQLTDLSRIWGETLDRASIVDRAGENGCSIDPTEDDQNDIFSDKIDSALRGDEGTQLELYAHGKMLYLTLSASMPNLLPTFKWSIHLARRSDAAVAKGLVMPLLTQAIRLQNQISQLVDELAAKDRVIAKVTDRLELSGNDLTAVFPGVSNLKTSRKKSQRAQLASHVKGLGDFDEAVWKVSVKQNARPMPMNLDDLNSALDILHAEENPASDELPFNDWWTKLSNFPTSSNSERLPFGEHERISNSKRQGHTSTRASSSADGESTDDEFQRQQTPPQSRQRHEAPIEDTAKQNTSITHSAQAEAFIHLEDEETDDDDLDMLPSDPSSSQTNGRSQQQDDHTASSHAESPGPRKLGLVGGRRSISSQQRHVPVSEPDAAIAQGEANSSKPTTGARPGALGGHQRTDRASRSGEKPLSSPTKPRAKFGTMGGKPLPATKPSEAAETKQIPAKTKFKLGTFGGKNRSMADPRSAEAKEPMLCPSEAVQGSIRGNGAMRSSSTNREEPPSEPHVTENSCGQKGELEREGSQERADKKRERLKQELEEKSKMPAKKKRKF